MVCQGQGEEGKKFQGFVLVVRLSNKVRSKVRVGLSCLSGTVCLAGEVDLSLTHSLTHLLTHSHSLSEVAQVLLSSTSHPTYVPRQV